MPDWEALEKQREQLEIESIFKIEDQKDYENELNEDNY